MTERALVMLNGNNSNAKRTEAKSTAACKCIKTKKKQKRHFIIQLWNIPFIILHSELSVSCLHSIFVSMLAICFGLLSITLQLRPSSSFPSALAVPCRFLSFHLHGTHTQQQQMSINYTAWPISFFNTIESTNSAHCFLEFLNENLMNIIIKHCNKNTILC